jgi:hypothetical protein
MLNRFVREVVVPQGQLRLPAAVQRFMNVRIMLPTTPLSDMEGMASHRPQGLYGVATDVS